MHLPPRLERQMCFLRHRDLCAIARVARGVRVPLPDREHAKVAQFNPVALRQGGCDGVQDHVDDLLRIPVE